MTTGVDGPGSTARCPFASWAWLPHDRAWLAAATQFPGTLFFNISTSAALVHNATAAQTGPVRLAARTSSAPSSSSWPARTPSWPSPAAS